MNETLVFLVSGVIAALISAMVCLLFRPVSYTHLTLPTTERV